ncbi:MAG TPA: hypothetical protein VM555_05195 [Tahibacter sp.]|nr:hypothetical protein [Tahibacter sp.]
MHADMRGYAATPWTAPGLPYRLDDGSYESSIGLGTAAAVWLNRYPLFEAQTIHAMSVMWPRQGDGGTLVGMTANLLAYYDADADGDPTNAVRLGADTLVTIGVLDAFETYATNFAVPGAGDVYLGFSEHWARNGYPVPLVAAAVDTGTWQGRSYVSARMPQDGVPPSIDIDHLGNNDVTGMLPVVGYVGNLLIRAAGADAACGGASVPWLSVTHVGDAVVGGIGVPIGVAIDPSAGDLPPGSHTAQLCIRTNDPAHRTIIVPVGLVVTAPLVTHACSTAGDGIFCDRFDGAAADDIVTSDLVDVDLPQNQDGLSFDFTREEWSAWPLRGDDYLPYWHVLNPVLMFYWHGDVMPGANGGVAKTVFGPYEVLGSGDTIGPDSTFSQIANGAYGETGPFLAGVDGYLGFKFYNEAVDRTNYGYIRIVTTWPSGYPAKVIGYAYNRSGGPITIP